MDSSVENVLLTCAGRRNYLVQAFREALVGRGHVYAADASRDAPALASADQSFILPRLEESEYLDRLLGLCAEKRIALLISLNDFELPIISANRDAFLAIGTRPVISSPDVIDICFDKWKTFLFLREKGVSTALTFHTLESALSALASGELSFPVVVKPRWGSGSIGVFHAHDAEELHCAHAFAAKQAERGNVPADLLPCSVIIQERLGGEEFGLDVVNDLSGAYASCFARKKLLMRAGETDRAMTVHDENLSKLAEVLGRTVGHYGNLDCDVFMRGGECSVLEMNPRFGGGYPFSHMAGANLPAALLAWHRGDAVNPSWLTPAPNVISAKFDTLQISPDPVDAAEPSAAASNASTH